jgi:hypothetical protein
LGYILGDFITNSSGHPALNSQRQKRAEEIQNWKQTRAQKFSDENEN